MNLSKSAAIEHYFLAPAGTNARERCLTYRTVGTGLEWRKNMFDKLIESNIEAAEFKGRSRYFMVSTVVVGILFVTALVFSLYAADIGLGVDSLEVSMMVAPVMPEAPEPPKPVQPEQQHRELRCTTADPDSRRTADGRDTPDRVPPISVAKNAFLSHPPGDFARPY